jgi:hypothetical protein
MRWALTLTIAFAACDVAAPEVAPSEVVELEQPATIEVPMPAPCWPVVQSFALRELGVRRLPPSQNASGRRSAALNLVEIVAIADRSDTARVVIGDHVFADMREPATFRRLVRWMGALHFEPDGGWEPTPRGWAIAADASIDASVVADIVALAAGSRLDDPVDVVLRMPGVDALTTIPVTIERDGIVPSVGSWGEWAATIDDVRQPAPLELPDAAGVWELRSEHRLPTTTLRIAAVAPARARKAVSRHRNELRACYLQAVMRDPDLAGTWSIAIARDRSVVISPAGDRFAACAMRAAMRWSLASVDVTVTGSVAH